MSGGLSAKEVSCRTDLVPAECGADLCTARANVDLHGRKISHPNRQGEEKWDGHSR